MAEVICMECANVVRPRQEAIECDICLQWQHRTCKTGISRDDYRNAVKSKLNITFNCSVCQALPTQEVVDEVFTEAFWMPEQLSDASFQQPDELEESSQDEDSILSVAAADDMSIRYEVIDSGTIRGRRKLVDNLGYSYTVKRQRTNSKIDWRCAVRNKSVTCKATVIQDEDSFTRGCNEHTHPSEPGTATNITVKSMAKKSGSTNGFLKSARVVVEEVCSEHGSLVEPEYSRPHRGNLIRAVNRMRQKMRQADLVDDDKCGGILC